MKPASRRFHRDQRVRVLAILLFIPAPKTAPPGGRSIRILPGQYFDAETGLHYNRARYYDLKIGRYISSDPIGLAGGLNTYLYTRANPLRYIDPLGLATTSCSPGTSSDPNCTVYDPNQPDTVRDN